jgi:hypothetical protein
MRKYEVLLMDFSLISKEDGVRWDRNIIQGGEPCLAGGSSCLRSSASKSGLI